ncbi:MAG: hypothetical protein H0V81_06245, partial [Solirubrobacterales bacterium]|nr:hypothetical protein [Solirubrobacterales bacterium]
FVRDGVIAAEGFVGPQPGTSEISVVRSAVRSSVQARAHHTERLGLDSAGTWAVSVSEVLKSEGRSIDDAECPDVDTPGHAYVDLRLLSRKERKRARVVLAAAATNRGQVQQAA